MLVLSSCYTLLRLWSRGPSHPAWPAQMFHFPVNEEPQQGVLNLIGAQPEKGRGTLKVRMRVTGLQPTARTNETNTLSIPPHRLGYMAELQKILCPAHTLQSPWVSFVIIYTTVCTTKFNILGGNLWSLCIVPQGCIAARCRFVFF